MILYGQADRKGGGWAAPRPWPIIIWILRCYFGILMKIQPLTTPSSETNVCPSPIESTRSGSCISPMFKRFALIFSSYLLAFVKLVVIKHHFSTANHIKEWIDFRSIGAGTCVNWIQIPCAVRRVILKFKVAEIYQDTKLCGCLKLSCTFGKWLIFYFSSAFNCWHTEFHRPCC